MFVVKYDNGIDQVQQQFTLNEEGLAKHMAQRHARLHGRAVVLRYDGTGATVVLTEMASYARKAA